MVFKVCKLTNSCFMSIRRTKSWEEIESELESRNSTDFLRTIGFHSTHLTGDSSVQKQL